MNRCDCLITSVPPYKIFTCFPQSRPGGIQRLRHSLVTSYWSLSSHVAALGLWLACDVLRAVKVGPLCSATDRVRAPLCRGPLPRHPHVLVSTRLLKRLSTQLQPPFIPVDTPRLRLFKIRLFRLHLQSYGIVTNTSSNHTCAASVAPCRLLGSSSSVAAVSVPHRRLPYAAPSRADLKMPLVSGLSAAHTIYLAGGNVLVLDKQGGRLNVSGTGVSS